MRIIIKVPLNKALRLRNNHYELEIECTKTPYDILRTLQFTEKEALLNDPNQLLVLSKGKVLDPKKSLESQIGCNDEVEVILLPAMEGG